MPNKDKKKQHRSLLDSVINQYDKWSRDNSSLEKTEHNILEKVIHGNPKISSARIHAGAEGPGFEEKDTSTDPDRVNVLYSLGQSFTEKISNVQLNNEKTVNELEKKIKDRKDEIKEMSPEERAELE